MAVIRLLFTQHQSPASLTLCLPLQAQLVIIALNGADKLQSIPSRCKFFVPKPLTFDFADGVEMLQLWIQFTSSINNIRWICANLDMLCRMVNRFPLEFLFVFRRQNFLTYRGSLELWFVRSLISHLNRCNRTN